MKIAFTDSRDHGIALEPWRRWRFPQTKEEETKTYCWSASLFSIARINLCIKWNETNESNRRGERMFLMRQILWSTWRINAAAAAVTKGDWKGACWELYCASLAGWNKTTGMWGHEVCLYTWGQAVSRSILTLCLMTHVVENYFDIFQLKESLPCKRLWRWWKW